MLPLSLDQLTFAAVEALAAAGGLRESKTLDFKRDLAGPKDDDKRELLADVSAFANTAGGDLVFGVDEEGGEATAVPGVAPPDADAEVRRIEAVLRSGLEPRLTGVEVRWIPRVAGAGGLLVVRSTRSFAAPHRVIFRDHGKFYGRTSAGKYPLDVGELRSAFLSADTLVQSIRRFRLERLSAITADEGPVPLEAKAKVALHIVPLSSFLTRSDVRIGEHEAGLWPLSAGSGFNSKHTLEGLATFPGPENIPGGLSSYTMLFRSGVVEAVACIGYRDQGDQFFVAATSFEWGILQHFGGYVAMLKRQDVDPPFYVFLSLLGVRSHCLIHGRRDFSPRHVLSRDTLLLPESVMDDINIAPETVLRPLFDMIYNGFGYPRSFNFDAAGKYIGERW